MKYFGFNPSNEILDLDKIVRVCTTQIRFVQVRLDSYIEGCI